MYKLAGTDRQYKTQRIQPEMLATTPDLLLGTLGMPTGLIPMGSIPETGTSKLFISGPYPMHKNTITDIMHKRGQIWYHKRARL